MFAYRHHVRSGKGCVAATSTRGERCRVCCALALYVLTSVAWPFEPVGASAKIVRRSGCVCSSAKKSSGTCCCAKMSQTASLTAEKCPRPVAVNLLPSPTKSCCGSKASKSSHPPAHVASSWTACDCPSEPGSSLAPVFQPRVGSPAEPFRMPPAPRAQIAAPTLCWIGADLEPPTPPPKIVL